jgi:hypothetical protein
VIADGNGLVGKIWIVNEALQEAGGLYLFANEADVHAYDRVFRNIAATVGHVARVTDSCRNILVKTINCVRRSAMTCGSRMVCVEPTGD